MSISGDSHWLEEFGVDPAGAEGFIGSKKDLEKAAATTQLHVLRRAFDVLKLDGVLATSGGAPLVYFKHVNRIEPADVAQLHKTFWNHGGAPLLVLVGPKEVHIYSGLVRPSPDADQHPGLVERVERASHALLELLPAVESGEFFRRHSRAFNPDHRVDRDLLTNLQATRDSLHAAAEGALTPAALDALLCRLVFACYLFDRGVIGQSYLSDLGVSGAAHLRDVLSFQPKSRAKKALYELFRQLGADFNGDLFSDDLSAEAREVPVAYITPLEEFFHGTDVATGQVAFWPYDFGVIPIEAISAIYERFLKASQKEQGAFYTPRALAELVLDVALGDTSVLRERRYLDPACGSGIFLVGLFNRMAEEWKQANPEARNDRRAKALRRILCENLHGIDVNPTACRITAFSLYLAYLDQLSPRDIQELREKGHRLPKLVRLGGGSADTTEGNIWCGDFFDPNAPYPTDMDVIVGNPPWGSTAVDGTPAARWCDAREGAAPIPDKQIAAAFLWKSATHVNDGGRVCLVLPHGILFNHSPTALAFERRFFRTHAVDRVLNLADFQRFLFEEAGHPAIVIAYRSASPASARHSFEYWVPKADWLATRAEVIAVAPEDRNTLTVGQVLNDLDGHDAPQIWKQWYWATARDRRLIDRLSLYPRLRDHVRRAKDKSSSKRWLMAVGFQPLGELDDPDKAKAVALPSRLFIPASSKSLDLFLLEDDCIKLPSAKVQLRRGSNTGVFKAPHVLMAKGMTSVAYADFDVSFQDAVRGISGPREDETLLIFLAAYLRSSVARYFLFQTSSNWGVSRQEVHVEELLRLPFPLPGATAHPGRAGSIITKVAGIVTAAMKRASESVMGREQDIAEATDAVEPLISEYFDIIPDERSLIDDTVAVVIPSLRPTRNRPFVPTVEPAGGERRAAYTETLCRTLNAWGHKSPYTVRGHSLASSSMGLGLVVLNKTPSSDAPPTPGANHEAVITALGRLRTITASRFNAFDLYRGVKVFDHDHLYVVKPLGQRFWTDSAALNDADEIAASILMSTGERS